MFKKIALLLLAAIAFVCITAGTVLYRAKEIAPLVFCPIYPSLGIALMLTGVLILVAFVFKWHHNNVPAGDMIKAWALVLVTFFIIWHFVTPAASKLLHRAYRHEVKVEVAKRVKNFFGMGKKKEDDNLSVENSAAK